MNDVSAIIVTYNSERHIRACLTALTQAGIADIIVVDNNSRDATRAILEEFKEVTTLLNDSNTGYTRAVNQGLKASHKRFLLVLNPDVEITGDAIRTLVTELKKNATIGIIAPKLVYPDDRLQYSCRRFPTLATFLLRGLGFTEDRPWMPRILHRHLMTDYDHNAPLDVEWVLGSCMLIRRELLQAIGMLDEKYFLYYSDIDFCLRATQSGWKVHYEPRAHAIHHYARTSAKGGGLLNPSTRTHIRSALRFFWRRLTKAV